MSLDHTKLLEREEPRARLEEALNAARAGRGRIVSIEGEAGIGKTSLALSFAEAHRRDARVYVGGCEQLATPEPLGPLHDIERESRGRFSVSATSQLATFEALLRLLTSGRDPGLLLMEDIHWADDLTLDLFRYLGLGGRAVRVPTDADGRMDAAVLAAALAEGAGPAIVIAQAGQMSTGAFDPVSAIARTCRQHGAWLHVDGAFGLWARAVPEMNDLTAGLEDADSWSIDGHKWLQLPYDSGFAVVRDVQAHRRAMSITASYLPAAAEAEYDPGQFVPELSRRARGFALWAQLRALGRQGVAEIVRRHCALARRLASRLASEPGVHVLNTVQLNQLIVNFGDGALEERNALTRATIARLQADNICLAGGADWRGVWVLRLSVISAPLTEPDVDRLAAAVLSAWRHVRREGRR